MTKEYCLASGYAETYERFCNQMDILPNPYFCRSVMKTNKERNGYYWRPDEKMLSMEDWAFGSKISRAFYDKMLSNNTSLIKAVASVIGDNKLFGVPYHSISGDDTLYMDPRMVIRMTHSIGMSAGNTREEALVQGISEIVEKIGCYYFFKNPRTYYHAIDLNSIKDERLQEVIHNIQDLNYDLYLIDLSYTLNIPVMVSVLVDRENSLIKFNVGCFPVFEIAAERVLTELYQGINTFKNPLIINKLQKPSRAHPVEELLHVYGNSITGEFFDTDIIDNLIFEKSYNTEVYCNKESSNEELLNYYDKLSHDLYDTSFYYIDNSLDDSMKAYHIFLNHEVGCMNLDDCTRDWNEMNVNTVLDIVDRYQQLYDMVWTKNNINPIIVDELLRIFQNDTILDFLGNIIMWHSFGVSDKQGHMTTGLDELTFLIYNTPEQIPEIFLFSPMYHAYRKYAQLKLYATSGLYSNKEILHICNDIYHLDVTEEDIRRCFNFACLVKRVYIYPLHNYLHSAEYQELIDIYVNNHRK